MTAVSTKFSTREQCVTIVETTKEALNLCVKRAQAHANRTGGYAKLTTIGGKFFLELMSTEGIVIGSIYIV